MFPGCSLASFLNRSETLLSAFCSVLAELQPARKSQKGHREQNNLLLLGQNYVALLAVRCNTGHQVNCGYLARRKQGEDKQL